jgi:hypothetical protein
MEQLYPSFISRMYSQAAIVQFADDNIEEWYDTKFLEAEMNCGIAMPTFLIHVIQFRTKGPMLSHHIQYSNLSSGLKHSIPIGMKKLDKSLVQQCDEYIRVIVRNHMDDFLRLYWMEETNKLEENIARLMFTCGKGKLMQLSKQLLVATFIMSHTLTITTVRGSADILSMLSGMRFPSSRLFNRQLKYAFYHLQWKLVHETLCELERTLHSCNDFSNWLPALMAVICICMVQEEQQLNFYLVARTLSKDAVNQVGKDEVSEACGNVDQAVELIMRAFHCWGGSIYQMGLDNDIVVKIRNLVKSNSKLGNIAPCMKLIICPANFLVERRGETITAADSWKLSARLLSRFFTESWTDSEIVENEQVRE